MSVRPAAVAYDVVIIGGGLVGSTLACALGDSDLKVALVEPKRVATAPATEYDVRVSALTLASQTLLDALGVWPGVFAHRVAPVRAMRVWEDADAAMNGGAGLAPTGEIYFDAAEIGEPCLAYIVENRVLLAVLQERVQQYTNVHAIDGAFSGLTLGERAEVALADGRRLHARLVVAADGADSAVRRQLHVPVRALDMRQLGVVATVRTERVHGDIAWQRFLPTGPLAFLPLPEARTCSIVWSLDQARAEQVCALDDPGFCEALRAAFDGRLGALEIIGPRAAFPLTLAHADRYIAARLALVGDAAHTVHPLAGQGLNLGLLDAAALAEVLHDAAVQRRDVGALHVLRRYERWRKGDNLAMLAITGGFKYLFGNDWRALAGLRSAGLGIANRVTPLKNLIMRRASGLVGDLPRLARRPGPTG